MRRTLTSSVEKTTTLRLQNNLHFSTFVTEKRRKNAAATHVTTTIRRRCRLSVVRQSRERWLKIVGVDDGGAWKCVTATVGWRSDRSRFPWRRRRDSVPSRLARATRLHSGRLEFHNPSESDVSTSRDQPRTISNARSVSSLSLFEMELSFQCMQCQTHKMRWRRQSYYARIRVSRFHFLARDVIHTSRAYAMSVYLSVFLHQHSPLSNGFRMQLLGSFLAPSCRSQLLLLNNSTGFQ